MVFYSYIYSMYKRQKTGERDFEKYSDLVLDDAYDSKPLEEQRKEDQMSSFLKRIENKIKLRRGEIV